MGNFQIMRRVAFPETVATLPFKKKRTWNHSHIQYPLGIRRLKSAWSLLIRTERSGVPHWRWFSRLKNMAIHLEPSFQVKFPIQSWETVLMY